MRRRRYDIFPLILPFSLSVAAGAVAQCGFPSLWLAVCLVSFLLLLSLWLSVRGRGELRSRLSVKAACVALVSAVGFSYGEWRVAEGRVPMVYAEGEVTMEGVVMNVRRVDTTALSFVVETDSFVVASPGEAVHVGRCRCLVRAAVSGVQPGSVVPGARLSVVGRCQPVEPQRFARFDYSAFLQENGISASVRADSVGLSASAAPAWHWLRHLPQIAAGKCQEALQRRLSDCGVGSANIAFLRALLLGDRSLLSPDVARAFRDCGTAHVLAVSGLHVGIVFFVVSFLMARLLPLHRKVGDALALLLIWAYAVVVGLSPSVVRASLMISCALLGRLTHRRGSFLHAFYMALAVQLALWPSAALSLGMWLSYAAVFGIIMSHRAVARLSPSIPLLRWLVSSLAVSLVAQLATTPLTLYAFHSFPSFFWLNNLVIVPLISVALCLALSCLAFGWVPLLGDALGGLTEWVLSALNTYALSAASLPGAVLADIPFSRGEMMGYSFAVLTLFVLLRWWSPGGLRLALLGLAVALTTTSVRRVVSATQSAVVVYDCGRGVVGLSVCEGRQAVHCAPDTLAAAFLRAADGLDARWGVSHSTLRLISGVETVEAPDGKRIAFAASEGMPVPSDCDMLVVASDMLPGEAPDSMSCVVSADCSFALLWKEMNPRARLIPQGGVVEIGD